MTNKETSDEFKKIMGCTVNEWIKNKFKFIHNENIDIISLENIKQLEYFGKTLGFSNEDFKFRFDILSKYFNDYNLNNYILCYIYVENDNKSFDEYLYNQYHQEYFKYYSKNPDIKMLIWTNNKDWCKLNFKFFNTLFIYYSN
jgi:hypothetical protein